MFAKIGYYVSLIFLSTCLGKKTVNILKLIFANRSHNPKIINMVADQNIKGFSMVMRAWRVMHCLSQRLNLMAMGVST